MLLVGRRAALVCAAIASLLASCTSASKSAAPSSTGQRPSITVPKNAGVPSKPTGVAAISPGEVGIPSYSLAVATNYVAHHRIPGDIGPDTKRITDVAFVRVLIAQRLLHDATIGLPTEAIVCVVLMGGDFRFSGPDKAVYLYPTAYELFDARSGNLLMQGGASAYNASLLR